MVMTNSPDISPCRFHYGIKEELFDLVMRLENVARVRARILYNAGYHTSTKVKGKILMY